MRTSLFLDTNVVIYALQGKQHIADLIKEEKLYLSFISEIELLSWTSLDSEDENLVSEFINGCQVVEYSSRLKEIVIDFRKRYRLKISDAFIAASAFQFEMLLVSADSIFSRIKEIEFFQVKP
jgi:predicted nucleic acid-binding protein